MDGLPMIRVVGYVNYRDARVAYVAGVEAVVVEQGKVGAGLHQVVLISRNWLIRMYRINKCSERRSMEVKLPDLQGNYNRQTDRQIDQPTAGQTGSYGSFTTNKHKRRMTMKVYDVCETERRELRFE